MNFAHALLCRLGKAPHLIDGASGARLDDVRGHVIASAAMLREAGLERGDRLLLAAQLDLDTVVAYLATMYAGCVAVPLPAAQAPQSDSGQQAEPPQAQSGAPRLPAQGAPAPPQTGTRAQPRQQPQGRTAQQGGPREASAQ